MKALTKRVLPLIGLVCLFATPALAKNKTIWICQATCLGFAPELGEARSFEGLLGQGRFQLDAYQELNAICTGLSRRAGFTQSTLASEVFYRSLQESSAEIAPHAVLLFKYYSEFELWFMPAALNDARVCSQQVVDENWVPPYYGPGNPQG
jgi:hypothetical protein